MLRPQLYLRLVLILAIVALAAVALGGDPWGPN